MDSVSNSNDVTSKMGELTLQPEVCNTNGKATPNTVEPPVSPLVTNSNSAPRPRTGIPRYAIPYRRPDDRSMGRNNSTQSPVSPAASETTQPNYQPSAVPRSKNGIRAESLGNDSTSSGFGASASQRYGRAASVDPLRGDSESEHSSAFSSSGQPRRITSKVGSLANAKYKPGGGNVKILDIKVDYSHAQSKCNSTANLKHKPSGGDVQIVDRKLDFKTNSKSRVNSLANAKYVPGGGDVTIFSEKLPWLVHNKPNLPPEEKAKINKHAPL